MPRLANELKEICREIGIDNINEKEITKEELDDAIYFHNYKEMKLEVSSYKKLETIKDEDFRELPDFMNDKSNKNARMAFRIKSGMVNKIKINFKGSFKPNLKCEKCDIGENKTQCHTMICPGWAEERDGLDLAMMSDMVVFFHRLLEDKGGKNMKEGLP